MRLVVAATLVGFSHAGASAQDAPAADPPDPHPLDRLEDAIRNPRPPVRETSREDEAAETPEREIDLRPVVILAPESLRRFLEDVELDLSLALNRDLTIKTAPSNAIVAEVLEPDGLIDVVIADDPVHIDRLVTENRADPETRRTFAWNRLILVQGPGRGRRSSVRFASGGWPTAAKIALNFSRAGAQPVVILDPENYAEGHLAKQALTRAGLWPSVSERIILADGPAAAARALAEGRAAFGVVFATTAAREKGIDRIAAIPIRDGGLIRYQASALSGAHHRGPRLTRLLASEPLRRLMARHGLTPAEDGALSAAATRDSILADPLLDIFGDGDG